MKTIALSTLALVMSVLAGFAVDTTAPLLTSASVAPNAVDVGDGAKAITLTLQITDDDSGFSKGVIYLYNAAENYVTLASFDAAQRLPNGSPTNGTYVVSLQVPLHAGPGTWRIDMILDDFAQNSRSFGPGSEVYPIPAAMLLAVDNTGIIDSNLPQVSSVTLPQTPLNVSTSSATMVVTVQCVDVLSGLNYGALYMRNPQGVIDYDLSGYLTGNTRISGDANNGIYEVAITLPQGSALGTWTFDVFLTDQVGNISFTPGGQFIVSDGSPPSLRPAASFLAQAVDAVQFPFTVSGGGWVMAIPNDSGENDGIDVAASLPIANDEVCSFQTTMQGPGTLSFKWRVDSEVEHDFLSVSVGAQIVQQISGETAWESISIAIPAGTQTVAWSYAKNEAVENGEDRGWVDQVRFTADSADQSPPILQAFRVSPRIVDLSEGARNIQFSIEVTDDLHGLSQGRLKLFNPSGNEVVSTTFDGTMPNSGTPSAGTYEVTLPLSDTDEFGLWRAEVELTEAGTNATRFYRLTGDPFPSKSVEYFYAGTPSAPDTSHPLVRALEVTPQLVNVGNGSTTAIVTLQITDEIAGFSDGAVTLFNSFGDNTSSFNFNGSKLIAGNEFNGIYQIEITIPEYGHPGAWTVGAYVSDFSFNYYEYSSNNEFPADVDDSFFVVNYVDIDQAAPEVTDFDVSPTLVDTSAGPAEVTVTVSIVDDLSGLSSASLYFYNPVGEFDSIIDLSVQGGGNQTSGNPISGSYLVSKTLPQGSMVGEWVVRLFVRDETGRGRFYGPGLYYTPFPGTSDGRFTVGSSALSLFDAFMVANMLTGNDALATADPDRDGQNNATELLLGTQPNNPASVGLNLISVSRDATQFYLTFTIDPTLTVFRIDNNLIVSRSGGGLPMRVNVQSSFNLTGPWFDQTPFLVSGSTYRLNLGVTGVPKQFGRLKFTNP